MENDKTHQTLGVKSGFFGKLFNFDLWKWRPSSSQLLQEAENKLFSFVKCGFEKRFVTTKKGENIWTVFTKCNKPKQSTPLVLVHGFGGGIGLFVLNYTALSDHRPVLAFDVLGFGQSSRPVFPTSHDEAENKFVQSIEDWRNELKIDKMILLGHSFGGYLSTCYALKHPERIKSLILADPWGFPERDPNSVNRAPFWVRCLITVLSPFNPLALVRAAGPFGPGLIKRLRSDFKEKFQALGDDENETILDYIYHCNANQPSGETAFKCMSGVLGYAANPLLNRIENLDKNIPLTFIYGNRSWMDQKSGTIAKQLLPKNHVKVYSIQGAGHHVYADNPEKFHEIVNSICKKVEDDEDTSQ